MNIIRAIIFLTSISASLSVSNSILSFRLKNQCSASVSTTDFGAILKDCPVPDINGVLQPSSTQVSSPATIREVLMKWSLDQHKNPKMKIVLDAISPNSAQEYMITVTSETNFFPLYCGTLSTAQPAIQMQMQMITLDMDCPRGLFQPSRQVAVTVEIKGAAPTATVERQMKIPGCQDPVMYHSNYCVEERRKRVFFTLSQQMNSVQVMISSQTIYPLGTTLYVLISIKDETRVFLPWRPLGSHKILTSPQTTVTFPNLVYGATYKVQVWRKTDVAVRYERFITLTHGVPAWMLQA